MARRGGRMWEGWRSVVGGVRCVEGGMVCEWGR